MPIRSLDPQWVFPELLDIPGSFQAYVGGSDVVSQTLYRRGFTSQIAAQGFLNPAYFQPSHPSQLPGLLSAVQRIQTALKDREPILIWGDFDVDGQTSTALLVSALTDLNADVQHYIPNRARESHGVSTESLLLKIAEFKPGLIITCDTGIDAFDPIKKAQNLGVDVIVTDHHQLPEILPGAYAIVNPNMLPSDHPLATLPGVGVAYKLVEGLFEHYDKNPGNLLDLVALGIVADVAQQTGDTRYLLQRGLSVLRKSPRLGLQQIYSNANVNPVNISEDHIGFTIGPRLNALGRLDDANSCVAFFTTQNVAEATRLADQLENLNERRRQLTEEIFKDSLKILKANPSLESDHPILVLMGSTLWNPGVIGIVASRLVDRYHKPVIMLTPDGDQARGSARSIPGVPIASLISQTSDLLNSFGGHPMAAGVNLPIENVSNFRTRLSEFYTQSLGARPAVPKVFIDAVLPFPTIDSSFIGDFQRLAPFGAGNPKLLFAARSVTLKTDKIIGKNKNHRKITLADSTKTKQDFLWWNSADITLPKNPFDIAFSLELSSYRGQEQIQATLQHFKESKGNAVQIKHHSLPELIDYRDCLDPEAMLSQIDKTGDVIFWAEHNPPHDYFVNRNSLIKSHTLIIWTSPPSPLVLKKAVTLVAPKNIIFFANDPKINSVDSFITRLHGLIKYYINPAQQTNRIYDSEEFAQRISQTSAIIEVGLDWIHKHGDYDLSRFVSDKMITPGPGHNLPGYSAVDQKLKFMLKEIASYRNHFTHVNLESLL